MKASQFLIACATILVGSVAAQAQTVVHITGSTAFRTSTVNAIQNLMGGPGNFKSAFQSTSGATVQASNQCVLQGSISGITGLVTVKCSWSGSTGGIITVVQNRDVTTWMSVLNLPADNTPAAIASPNYQLDSTVFTAPIETLKADVTMQDSSQASTGFTTVPLTQKKVGIVAFEWVAGNGTPPELNNITPLLAQNILSGGALLSQFTGNPAHTTPVYAAGRNFDSGTRLSCLAETGVGVFGGVQHVEVLTTGGAVGTANATITTLKLYHAENILDQDFTVGQSGYGSGGTLADVLATPGSASAATEVGVAPAEQVGFGPGYLLGYLGRPDAQRAIKTSIIAGNLAHRVKWNGFAIANEAHGNTAAGVPVDGYNDFLIAEGLYNLWEYEYLAYRAGLDLTRKAVADKIATQIETVDVLANGLKLNSMHVSKPIEGGLITHL